MTERTLADWLNWQQGLHPNEIDLGLDRVRDVAGRLGLPDAAPKTVVISGTNGKGSVVSLLEAALRRLGYRVGAYTSPHLVRYNERIRIDARSVEDAAIVEAFAAIDASRHGTSLSYFEFGTLAALWLFREHAVDWQLLEIGLGGRLDAVNMVDADLSVITSIGLDHQEWLGPDREHIAVEKAHVARRGRPCVVIEEDLPDTLMPTLSQLEAETVLAGRDYWIRDGSLTSRQGLTFALPKPPGLLRQNVAGALQALECLGFRIDDPEILDAVDSVQLSGRRQVMERLQRHWVLDVAHNLEAAEALSTWLEANPCAGKTVAIYGSLSDKPFRDILKALSEHINAWFFPRFQEVARSVDPSDLLGAAQEADVSLCDDFDSALGQALASTCDGDRIVVFGSFITVGAALEQLTGMAA